ncbi:hypothetical protein LZC95_19605 [Pendulispora brunnea]|uniref:Transglycosylase SLT domain-containing protein n=1 Tax=Pendulispora brunnea TaxID=2905690 RepID=A0ABZ2KKE6_9BACT
MEWILVLMLLVQPTAPWANTYEETARAIAHVVAEEEPLFDGPDGRAQTAATLVSLAFFESRFDQRAQGDAGHSTGLFQSWGGGAALFDPTRATRAALAAMRESLHRCRHRPSAERLASYASGSCDRGRAASRVRMALAARLLRLAPPPPEPPML